MKKTIVFLVIIPLMSLTLAMAKESKPSAKPKVVIKAKQIVVPAKVAKIKLEKPPEMPIIMPVVSVSFYPLKGRNLDLDKTGDVSGSYRDIKKKVNKMKKLTLENLNAGSKYKGYADKYAKPSLVYQIVTNYEFKIAVPIVEGRNTQDGIPYTDYHAIMALINAQEWVEKQAVKEIWIWGYDGGKVKLWESNMASPYGDISNSNRDQNDLPIYAKTYTVYNYNYGRRAEEAIHNHIHQIEHLINYIDGREIQDRDKWDELLFWGKFVGSDYSHKLINPAVGWCHYPPNALKDYEYHSKRKVKSDMLDWKPDRSGKRTVISRNTWNNDEMTFYRMWMQSIPGYKNGLKYKGKKLIDWWIFIGDWDYAMRNRLGLLAGDHPEHIKGKKRVK